MRGSGEWIAPKSVGYVVLLSGKVTLLLDEDEVDLEPGDVARFLRFRRPTNVDA